MNKMQRIGVAESGVPRAIPRFGRICQHGILKASVPRTLGKLQNIQYQNNIKVHSATTDEKEGYDVYVYEPERLQEGVRKHTLSVFVADESGLINRVAGVFARRGANIESLAVGLTVDKALFTIVATGTDSTVSNLCKQLAKLVNVRFVEDITDQKHIERELMLIKVQASPGPIRTEIAQIAQIFRAMILDVGESTFTLGVTGDPGKIAAFVKTLNKYGIVQLVRTGRIAVKRGDNVFTDPSTGSSSRWGLQAPTVTRSATEESSGFGVYANDSSDENEDSWVQPSLLDAAYAAEHHKVKSATFSIDVQDVPGVLNQVTGVVSRRGFNVQSLAVGNSEKEGMSRITMVVPGEEKEMDNLVKQLYKLVYVSSVTQLQKKPHVARELMLIKITCTPAQRGEIIDVSKIFHGVVVDLCKTTATIQIVGKEDKMRALQDILEPYGILEIARTGRIALERESGVDSAYLREVAGSRVML